MPLSISNQIQIQTSSTSVANRALLHGLLFINFRFSVNSICVNPSIVALVCVAKVFTGQRTSMNLNYFCQAVCYGLFYTWFIGRIYDKNRKAQYDESLRSVCV